MIGLAPSDLGGSPLSQFQAKQANEQQTWELIRTINKALNSTSIPEDRLKKSFDQWWSSMASSLENLPAPKNNTKIMQSFSNTVTEGEEPRADLHAEHLGTHEAHLKAMLYDRRIAILSAVLNLISSINDSEGEIEIEPIQNLIKILLKVCFYSTATFKNTYVSFALMR